MIFRPIGPFSSQGEAPQGLKAAAQRLVNILSLMVKKTNSAPKSYRFA
jgi:hypothetical protein